MPFWRVQGGRMWGRQDAWPHCWVPVTTDTPRVWTCATALQSDALWVNQHLPVMLQLSLSLTIPHYLCKWTTKLQTISNLPKKKDSPQGLFYNFPALTCTESFYDAADIFDASLFITTFFMTLLYGSTQIFQFRRSNTEASTWGEGDLTYNSRKCAPETQKTNYKVDVVVWKMAAASFRSTE